MKISKKFTQLPITDGIEEYLEKRLRPLARLLKRFEEKGEVTIFVELARTTQHHRHGDIFYAEGTFTIGEKIFRAEYTDSDIRRAIDVLGERLREDVRKYKEKGKAKRRQKKMF